MAIYMIVFLAGLIVGQWLAVWGLLSILTEAIQSPQE